MKSATVINVYVGVMKLARSVASECTAPKSWQLNKRLDILSKISRSTNAPFLNKRPDDTNQIALQCYLY
ncbi:hypothetical protein EEO57_10720 [Escherichia albertii]|nr:hypothetical protein [Escherichia albertii]EFB5189441.1 hypothetical protein [Escherichia albertii]